MEKILIEAQQDLTLNVTNAKVVSMKPMFDFAKNILVKVSFDKDLFRKELQKSINHISKREKALLFIWCLYTFGEQYKEIVLDVFRFR